MKYVGDIWNVTANNFHSGNYIFAHLNVKTNWIAEFAKIKSLIPIRWKKILKGLNCVDKDDNLLKNPSNFSFNHSQILLNGQEIPQSKLKQKHLFYACLYPTQIPKCVMSWQTIFGMTVNINEVFAKLPCSCLYERKGYNLHWNVLHKAVFSEKRLQIMGKSDGICKVCNNADETLTHLFYDCTYIQPVWNITKGILELLFAKDINLCMRNVFFCIQKTTSNLSVFEITLCNIIILITKWEIWKHRNNVKHDNSVKIPNQLLCKNAMITCKKFINILLSSCRANNLDEEFVTILKAFTVLQTV